MQWPAKNLFACNSTPNKLSCNGIKPLAAMSVHCYGPDIDSRTQTGTTLTPKQGGRCLHSCGHSWTELPPLAGSRRESARPHKRVDCTGTATQHALRVQQTAAPAAQPRRRCCTRIQPAGACYAAMPGGCTGAATAACFGETADSMASCSAAASAARSGDSGSMSFSRNASAPFK